MWKHIHASRFIYNYMLDMQNKRYESGEKRLSAFDMNKELSPMKKLDEYAWLNEVSNWTLKIVCSDLDYAYKQFFNHRCARPVFKSRKSNNFVFPVRCETGRFYFDSRYVKIEKIGKIRYKSDRDVLRFNDMHLSNARIRYKNGKWLLSFGVRCENQARTLTDNVMGIDLGIKNIATVSVGNQVIVFQNINNTPRVKKLKKKISALTSKIAKKYTTNRKNGIVEKSHNIIKCEKRLAKLHAHLSNIRKDYIHKTTHSLVMMLPKKVVMETLSVSCMMKNKSIRKYIQEQLFYEFVYQMQYKCDMYGIEFVRVPRLFPSSKKCSCCGNVKKNLSLSDRTYICDSCGFVCDRDLNAAINLMNYT